MPDDFNTLSNRLLSRAPAVGINLAQQLINDAWRQFQALGPAPWSWRRGSGVFAPPNLYTTGTATTNVGGGNPTRITGNGTNWTADMIGRQIRIGGLLYPYYTIVAWESATSILVNTPWAGADVTAQPYQILKIYYPTPSDFGFFLDQAIISIKDAYRLNTTITESDLAILDPQRTNQGQTYAVVYRNAEPTYGGIIGPIIPVAATGDSPISTTTTGYSYVANATYIVQVVLGGATGVATFQWMRAGQSAFTGPTVTSAAAQNLMDGVQIYWPNGQTYVANDLFVINAQSLVTEGGPVYELWPAPTYQGYLYTYLYVKREYDLTTSAPSLPAQVANRGDVLLEMALAACARFPGTDPDNPNQYYNLTLAQMHERRATDLINEMQRNDQEVGVSNIDYKQYPEVMAPWLDGRWQQSHAPFLGGSW